MLTAAADAGGGRLVIFEASISRNTKHVKLSKALSKFKQQIIDKMESHSMEGLEIQQSHSMEVSF